MSVLIFLSAFGVLVLLATLWVFRSGKRAPDLAELEKHIQPVDLEIFTNLLEPEQETYLKQKLSRKEFRRYKRMRFLAAHRYISRAATNAGILITVGRRAARSPDTGIAVAGRELAEAALRMRLYSVLAEVMLCLQLVLPRPPRTFASFIRDYDRMKNRLVRLSSLAVPLQNRVEPRYF